MKIIEIYENTILELDNDYINSLEKLLRANPNLPITIVKNTVEFSQFFVGEIQTEIIRILIKPRNPALKLSKVFEMAAFVSIDNFIEIQTKSHSVSNSFGVTSVSEIFSNVINLLQQNGLTGNMKKHYEHSHFIRGNLVMEKFHRKKIPLNKIEYFVSDYTLDIDANRIIKSAINKIISIENNKLITSELIKCLRDFDYISEYSDNFALIEDKVQSFTSSNPYYSIALEYSAIILNDLKIEYGNKGVNWYSFLLDSNLLFERYVRKLMFNSIPNKVTKWDKPKIVATGNYDQKKIEKSYIPDILIDYDESNIRARAVIDVKNKYFNPKNKKVEDLVSSSDLYQIIFYCRNLDSKVGALIYPCEHISEPIRLDIITDNNISIYLIGLPIFEGLENISKFLKKEIQTMLIYS